MLIVVVFIGIMFVIGIMLILVGNSEGDGGKLFVNDTIEYRKTNRNAQLNTEQKYEIKRMNRAFKCSCGITSRQYQFKGKYNNICPHCNKELDMRYNPYGYNRLNEVADVRDFPFAPKLTEVEFIRLWNRKEEEERIKKELEILESNDKEIEAWQNIQLKKMEEYKKEAERIERELKESNFDFKTEEFIKQKEETM